MREMCKECPWRHKLENLSSESLRSERHDIHACHMINKKKYDTIVTQFIGDKQLTYCIGSVNYAKARNKDGKTVS